MPFVETNDRVNFLDPPKVETPIETIDQVENESPKFWSETIPAAFEKENSIVSGLSAESITGGDYDSSFIPSFEGYEEYADRFSYAFNKDQEQKVKINIDREKENEEIIRDSGWLGMAATFAASILDPINLIPVGGQAARVYKTGSMLKGGLSVARAGLLSSTVSEAALHASQETRTWGESAANITAGTLLSGVIGGVSASFAKAKTGVSARTLAEIEKDVTDFTTVQGEGLPDLIVGQGISEAEAKALGVLPEAPTLIGEGGSIGAAQKKVETNEIKTILGSEKLKILTVGDKFSPINRTLMSSNIKTRENVVDLTEVSYILEKNTRGVATKHSVETIIKSETDVAKYRLYQATTDAFQKYRDTKIATIKDMVGIKSDKLNFKNFKKEIDRAMRNNDSSEIKEVAEAARKLRTLSDDVYAEAVKLELAPKIEGAPKGAPSWMKRIYDKEAIQNNRTDWQGRLRKWFSDENPNLDQLEIEDLVSRTTDNILGRPEDLPIFNTTSGGAFKERVFDIPDELIQDYLVQDIDVVLGGFFKKAIREIELKRSGFDDKGLQTRLEDMTQQSIQDLRKIENSIKLKAAEKKKAAKTEKEIAKIEEAERKEIAKASKKSAKELANDKDNIKAMRDRIRGTYQLNSDNILTRSQFADTVKSLNYSRLLGRVALSSIPDVAMPVMINGITRTLRDQMIPFIRDLGHISQAFSKTKGSVRAQSVQELRDMGIALDLILNTRVENFADLGSSFTGSKLSSFNSSTTKALSYLSGISAWNDKMKLMSGYSAMARILRASQGKKISKSDTEFLARFGIDSSNLKKIGDQFRVHGSKENGRFASGSGDWTDKEAYKVFQNSIRKFVDQTIIVSGQEKPLFASTAVGSILLQFKSFALSSFSKVFIAGLQQADMAALNGAVMMISLGMLSSYVKVVLSGKEPSDDIGEWIKEGVDKSGILGHLFDVNETLSKVGWGLSDGPISRYKSRSAAGALLGPSFSLLEDITGTAYWMSEFMKGERPTEADIRKTRRMIPFQNVFYLRKLFDMAEEGIGSAVGATSTSKKQR